MQTYGQGGSRSKRTKNTSRVPSFFRVNPVKAALALISTHGPKGAYNVAVGMCDNIERTIQEGALSSFSTGKDVQRNRGFWHSVEGYIRMRHDVVKR